MKKKLLIMLAVVSMLVCIFAISVSAKTVTTVDGKEVTVTTYDDAPARTNITVSTDDVVVFDDGFVCPSGYIFKDRVSMYNGNGNAAISGSIDLKFVNGKRATEVEGFVDYTYANIKELDIPEGVTHIGRRSFQSVTTIERVTIPKTAKTFDVAIFQNATGLLECEFEHTATSEATVFPGYIFYGCKNLRAFSMPDCFTEINDVGHFTFCEKLTAVHLSENLTKWTSGGGGRQTATFDNCYLMYFVNETFTYDNVPTKPEVYYFPKDLEPTTSGSDFNKNSTLRNCKNLNDVLVFGTKVTVMQNDCFFQAAPKNKVVFLADTTKIMCGAWGVAYIYFANQSDVDATTAGLTLKTDYGPWGGTAYYCNAADNTVHLYLVESNTAPTCTQPGVTGYECFCGLASDESTVVPALGHEENELLNKYFATVNGTLDYYNDMITEHSCTRCDAIIEGTEKGTALFTKKGYSYSENDATTFSYTIYVNQDAIKAYNEALLYGIVVSANANGAPISYADGAISHDNKTIVVEFQSTDVAYSIITAKLTGVTATTELHLSAYCVDNGAVSYLGHNTVDKIAEIVSYEALTTKYPDGKEE